MVVYRHRMTGPGPAGDVWVATLHSSSVAGLSTAHNAFVTFAESFWNDTYKAMCAPGVQLANLITDQLDPVTGHNVAQQETGEDIVGTGAGQQVDPRSCVVVGLITGTPTRAGRGRLFLPGPDASHYADTGEYLDATISTIATQFALGLGIMAGSATPVIYHRGPKTTTNIASVKVGTIAGTQRRRTNKAANSYWNSGV